MTSDWARARPLSRTSVALLHLAFFALLSGTARGAHYLANRWLTDSLQWTGDDVVWMAPIAHLIVFAVPGLPLAVAAALWPRVVSERLVAFVFATLAVFSFLLLFPRIHHLASFALSVGVGLQLAAWLGRRPKPGRRLMRWTTAALGIATALAGAIVVRGESRAERRALASLPAAREGAPNVLLLILDTVRSESMHLYGLPRPNTPGIDRLAAEGITFDHATATTSWTLPMHVTLLSGRYPTGFEADWLAPMEDSVPHLADVMGRHGYATGGFVANLNYTTRETGLARGFARWRDYRRTTRELLLSVPLLQSDLVRDLRAALIRRDPLDALLAAARFQWASSDRYLAHDRKAAGVVVDEFLDWEQGVSARPWFAMLNFFDAHAPYKPQSPFDTMFTAAGPAADYEAAIATIDRELGRLLDELRARGADDRTIIVVTSDHGELLGEHGMWEHGDHLWLPLLRVPLVIRLPSGAPAGVRVARTISLRDLPATLLDLAGIAPAETPIGGVSLRDTWEKGGAAVSPAFAVLSWNVPRGRGASPPLRYASLVTDSLQYIADGEGNQSLFDLHADPNQAKDISRDGTDGGRAAASRLHAELLSMLGHWQMARRDSAVRHSP